MPTFTCGFVRSNFAFAIFALPYRRLQTHGGHERDRTVDLLLTMQLLYRLSYVASVKLERETGFEPATLSLEG